MKNKKFLIASIAALSTLALASCDNKKNIVEDIPDVTTDVLDTFLPKTLKSINTSYDNITILSETSDVNWGFEGNFYFSTDSTTNTGSVYNIDNRQLLAQVDTTNENIMSSLICDSQIFNIYNYDSVNKIYHNRLYYDNSTPINLNTTLELNNNSFSTNDNYTYEKDDVSHSVVEYLFNDNLNDTVKKVYIYKDSYYDSETKKNIVKWSLTQPKPEEIKKYSGYSFDSNLNLYTKTFTGSNSIIIYAKDKDGKDLKTVSIPNNAKYILTQNNVYYQIETKLDSLSSNYTAYRLAYDGSKNKVNIETYSIDLNSGSETNVTTNCVLSNYAGTSDTYNAIYYYPILEDKKIDENTYYLGFFDENLNLKYKSNLFLSGCNLNKNLYKSNDNYLLYQDYKYYLFDKDLNYIDLVKRSGDVLLSNSEGTYDLYGNVLSDETRSYVSGSNFYASDNKAYDIINGKFNELDTNNIVSSNFEIKTELTNASDTSYAKYKITIRPLYSSQRVVIYSNSSTVSFNKYGNCYVLANIYSTIDMSRMKKNLIFSN